MYILCIEFPVARTIQAYNVGRRNTFLNHRLTVQLRTNVAMHKGIWVFQIQESDFQCVHTMLSVEFLQLLNRMCSNPWPVINAGNISVILCDVVVLISVPARFFFAFFFIVCFMLMDGEGVLLSRMTCRIWLVSRHTFLADRIFYSRINNVRWYFTEYHVTRNSR
jgi:hypothetical protein